MYGYNPNTGDVEQNVSLTETEETEKTPEIQIDYEAQVDWERLTGNFPIENVGLTHH